MAKNKRDFSAINTDPVYNTIANATAEPEAQEVPEAQEKEDVPVLEKKVKTYTDQEALELMETMRTSGRRGLKMARINMAFRPGVYQYIQTMAKVRGQTLTQFLNDAMEEHMKLHDDIYRQAIEFRRKL